MVDKRVFVILGLLVAFALAEKKINLEDIERDNLRAESKSSSNDIGADDASYGVTDKPEVSQQQDYQRASQQYQPDEGSARYAPQQLQQKYAVQSDDYQEDVKYVESDAGYKQTSQPVQQYVGYQQLQQQQQQQQQVEPAQPKVHAHSSAYEAPQQRLVYQQEVEVGNQYQSVQQKAASDKYLKNSNKDAVYINIPMDQLLSYYPNLSFDHPQTTKTTLQPLLHRLASEAARQISIPVYSPNLRHEPIYAPSKVEYQIQPQYSSSYSARYSTPSHTEAILPTKQPKKLIYAQSPLTNQEHQQPQQYLQEIVYVQPGVLYGQSGGHEEIYARPSIDLQASNSLGQSYDGQTTHQQQYSPAYSLPDRYYTLQSSPQFSHQIYQHQHAEENQAVPEAPGHAFDLPRLPAQNFKSAGAVRLVSLPRGSYDLHYTPNHLVHSSAPKSLLDSYVPSRLIAAQDSERYRERPIKLEGGFLPSKINFAQTYKKRKAE